MRYHPASDIEPLEEPGSEFVPDVSEFAYAARVVSEYLGVVEPGDVLIIDPAAEQRDDDLCLLTLRDGRQLVGYVEHDERGDVLLNEMALRARIPSEDVTSIEPVIWRRK